MMTDIQPRADTAVQVPLHANTPTVTSLHLSLALLRTPEEGKTRILVTRTFSDPLSRTTRLYGARKLINSSGTVVAEAVTVSALSGQPLSLNTADGDESLALSDATGRPLWSRNAQGTVTTVRYEGAGEGGRPVSLTETAAGAAEGRARERYGYHPLTDGKVRARNLAGTTAKHCNNAGVTRPLSVSLTRQLLASEQQLLKPEAGEPDWPVPPGSSPDLEDPLTVHGTYDATGAPLTQTSAYSVTTVSEYDIRGAVSKTMLRYKDTSGPHEVITLKDILYRADGVVLSKTSGNGITEEYTYDPQRQYLSRHTTFRPDGHPQGALLISDLHYTYDPAGNILSLEDRGTDPVWYHNQRVTGERKYTYDSLYRLTSATGRERHPVSADDRTAGYTWSPYTERYTYDDGDNLTQTAHTGGSGTRTVTMVVSQSSNRAVKRPDDSTTPDPDAGFLTGGLQKQLSDGRVLSWHADGQLLQVSPVTRDAGQPDDTERYHYADGGTRTRKIRTTQTAGGMQTSITTYAGGTETRQRRLKDTLQLDIVIIEGEGVRLIHNRLTGEVHLRYSFSDRLGSTGGETDPEGKLTSREVYLPYGGSAGSVEEAKEIHDRTRRYSGKERDATGLLYYGWRYYQPETRRWLSADPGGLIDGINLFRMCRNNPLTWTDLDGLMPKRQLQGNSGGSANKKSANAMSFNSLFADISGPSSSANSLFSGIASASESAIQASNDGLFSGATFGSLLGASSSAQSGTSEENIAFTTLQEAFTAMPSVEAQSFIGHQKIDTAKFTSRLSPLEYAALRAYMADNIYYELINENEVNGRVNDNINAVSDAISSALKKAEKYNGLTFRGTAGWAEVGKEGESFVSNFMSTSKSSEIVKKFMRKYRKIEPGDRQTRFVIAGSSGGVLSSVITENLEEVLFTPGTKFNIIFKHEPDGITDKTLRILIEETDGLSRHQNGSGLINALDLDKTKAREVNRGRRSSF